MEQKEAEKMIPIYLCDDEPAVRRGIRTELEKEIRRNFWMLSGEMESGGSIFSMWI